MLSNQIINTPKLSMLFLALFVILSCNFISQEDAIPAGSGKPIPITGECLPSFRNPTDINFPILAEGSSGWDNLNTEILMQAVIVDINCPEIINREKIEFVSTGSKYSDGTNAAKDFSINILSISEWTDIGQDNHGRNLYRVGFNVIISSNLVTEREYFIHPTWDIYFHRSKDLQPDRAGTIVAHYKFNSIVPTNTAQTTPSPFPPMTVVSSPTNIPPTTEASPTPKSPSVNDRDGDGVLDDQDKCPDQGDQGYGLYSDGCPKPPPDRDGDGIPDHQDACPDQGDEGYGLYSNGCPKPPPDRDGDGIPDHQDACPDQGDQGYGLYSNGCPKPPPDRDGDGVPDSLDSCPDQGDQGYGLNSNGCPYDPKDDIEICFNGNTKTVNREKLQDWLNRGATEGACH